MVYKFYLKEILLDLCFSWDFKHSLINSGTNYNGKLKKVIVLQVLQEQDIEIENVIFLFINID